MPEIAPGDLLWISPDVVVGREQAGRRPALVIAGLDYLNTVETLVVVVPITTVPRGWPNHVPIHGGELPRASWAMTEHVRTVSRERISDHAGRVDADTLAAVRGWVRDFLDL